MLLEKLVKLITTLLRLLPADLEKVEEIRYHFMKFGGVDRRLLGEDACDVMLKLGTVGEGQALAYHALDGQQLPGLSG